MLHACVKRICGVIYEFVRAIKRTRKLSCRRVGAIARPVSSFWKNCDCNIFWHNIVCFSLKYLDFIDNSILVGCLYDWTLISINLQILTQTKFFLFNFVQVQ